MIHRQPVRVCVLATTTLFAMSASVFAQTAPSSGAAPTDTSTAPATTAPTQTTPPADPNAGTGATGTGVSDNARMNAAGADPNNLPPHDPNRLLMREVGSTLSLGWRVWYQSVPGFIIGLFAKIVDRNGWGGGGGTITGPELVYRNGSVDIALGVQYVGYFAGTGHLHGLNEGVNATEQIRADIWSIQMTSHFLYGIRANRYFEFQIGAGLGAGFLSGTLNRYQARETPGTPSGFTACTQADRMGSEPCNSNVNSHFADSADPVTGYGRGGYSEGNWIATGGGYVPLIIPWLSLPHIALHFRPHRNFDFRIDGGFNLIGFYGGGALHYVF